MENKVSCGSHSGSCESCSWQGEARSNLHSWCLLLLACGEPVSSRGHQSWGPAELQKHLLFCSSWVREARISSLLVIMVNTHLLTRWRVKSVGIGWSCWCTWKDPQKSMSCDTGTSVTEKPLTYGWVAWMHFRMNKRMVLSHPLVSMQWQHWTMTFNCL